MFWCDRVSCPSDHVSDPSDHVSNLSDHVSNLSDHVSNLIDRILNPIDHVSNLTNRVLNPIDHVSNLSDRISNLTNRVLNFNLVKIRLQLAIALMPHDLLTKETYAKDKHIESYKHDLIHLIGQQLKKAIAGGDRVKTIFLPY